MKQNESDILFSIKPKYINLIINNKKSFEYRPHFWNVEYPYWFTVYESSPTCKIKYRMLLDYPFKPGETLPVESYGTKKFNQGNMGNKLAYPILSFQEIDSPISLDYLRSIKVFPPQDFLYINKKKELKIKLNDI